MSPEPEVVELYKTVVENLRNDLNKAHKEVDRLREAIRGGLGEVQAVLTEGLEEEEA